MITKHRILFIAGTLIVLNSVLFGLPFPYESILNIVLGMAVVVLTYFLTREKRTSHHRDSREPRKRTKTPDVFVESQPRINRSVNPASSVAGTGAYGSTGSRAENSVSSTEPTPSDTNTHGEIEHPKL